MTAQEHLDLIDAVIEKRLRGDAYESYSEAEARFGGTPLEKLYSLRTDLQQEIAASAGGNFRLAAPFSE